MHYALVFDRSCMNLVDLFCPFVLLVLGDLWLMLVDLCLIVLLLSILSLARASDELFIFLGIQKQAGGSEACLVSGADSSYCTSLIYMLCILFVECRVERN